MFPLRHKRRSPPPSASAAANADDDMEGLPPPALASSSRRHKDRHTNANTSTPGLAVRPASKKTTTFDGEQHRGGVAQAVRVHWSKFKKRISPGTLTESLVEITESQAGSESLFRRPRGGSEPADAAVEEEDEVDEIVVDNTFWVDGGHSGTKSLTQPSEKGGGPGGMSQQDKSGNSATHGTHATDADSLKEPTGLWKAWDKCEGFFLRLGHAAYRFFFTTFYDPVSEAQYRKETYYQGKALAFWGSLFVVLNWVLVCILLDRENAVFWDKIFYWAISPVLCVPLVPMVIFDVPRNFPVFYQLWLSFTLWSWAGYNLLMLQFCGYYTGGIGKLYCPSKEFLGIFYYTTAFPVIGLFSLGQNRFMCVFMAIFTLGLIASVIKDRQTWIRNTLNFFIFTAFVVWIHFQKESAERRLFTMRDRLKVQYRATQQAQVSESKAADSKKRFSSYIFHEVRVPLNTALLAVQNMEAVGTFRKDDIEFTALEGSLTMMSKVLNDVLDFNRMDSGRFESVSKPYAFHKVMRSMLVPLQLAANARDLELIAELDPQVDVYARTALYFARGLETAEIKRRLADEDEESALVVGDEHRLRQIVTNLTSNACKFTPTGGKIWVRTKLILPPEMEEEGLKVGESGSGLLPLLLSAQQSESVLQQNTLANATPLSAGVLRQHNTNGVKPTWLDRAVIRIEVEDTGVGIKKKDMIDNRLFSPYVQTDIGKFQGGKGTGLGLALSKHIIRLSGGRLGVKSKRNMGSTFWVELSMGVGAKVLEKQDLQGKDNVVAQTFSGDHPYSKTNSSRSGSSTRPVVVLPPPPVPPIPSPPPSSTAMRQLMEHSGQIELRTRGATPSTLSLSNHSGGAPSPVRLPMPPPQYSFGSSAGGATASGDSEVVTPFTPPADADPTKKAGAETPTPKLELVVEAPTPPSKVSISSAPSPPPPSSTQSPATFDPPLSVLVVDDDGLTRKLMSRMLTRIGCTVETAENGKAALDVALGAKNPFTFQPEAVAGTKRVRTPYLQEEDPKFDVIFLDNQMPVMSGVEMVRRLRELKRRDFVVGVTGNALKEDQKEYLDAGVDAVLTKPVREASLRTFLHVADERRRNRMVSSDGEGSEPPASARPP